MSYDNFFDESPRVAGLSRASRNRVPPRRLRSVRLAASFLLAASACVSGALATNSVEVTLEGEIPASCGVSSVQGGFDFGTAIDGTEQSVSMGVDCNVPYLLTARSLNGGLRTDASAGPGVSNAVAYDFRVVVPTTGAPVLLACSSAQLSGESGDSCGQADSGDEISVGQTASISMHVRDAGGLLAAGQYDDVIVVQVYPRS